MVLVERVPGGHRVGPRRQLSVLRDHAELLLPLECLVAVGVVPLVELAGVLVGPFLRHVVRRVAAAGREVGEPRLLGILCVNPVEPLDRLVGHVVRQVVRLVALAFRDADGRVVDRDHRVPLAGLAAEEAPEVVEPPGVRPAVERAARPLLVVRRQVPLAEDAGRIAVLLQDLRERSAILGQEPRVAGEAARELSHGAEADRVVVAPGEQRSPRRRAQRRYVEAVVLETVLAHAVEVRCRDRAPERARLAEARVVDQHEENVRRSLRGLDVAHLAPVRLRSLERPVRDTAERRPADRKLRPVDRLITHLVLPQPNEPTPIRSRPELRGRCLCAVYRARPRPPPRTRRAAASRRRASGT